MSVTQVRNLPRFDRSNPYHWLAFGFGTGLSPTAPGTFGTLAAVPVYLLLSWLPVNVYLLVLLVLIAVGVQVCGRMAMEMGEKDPPAIVFDEILGFLLAMTAAPAGGIWILAGFLLFRLFDITKPWPVRALQDRLKGGLGIVADDLAAGAMAWFVLQTLGMIVTASLRGAH